MIKLSKPERVRWMSRPFVSGSVTPTNRTVIERQSLACAHCGSVSIIGGNALRQTKTLERFFCDIQCAGEYKRWHNRGAEYAKRYALSNHGQKLQRHRAEKFASKLEETKNKWTCCAWCGNAYLRKIPSQYCCSDKCASSITTIRTALKNCMVGLVLCRYCGIKKHFKTRAKKRKYCSKRCEKRYDKQNREHLRRANGPVDIIGLKTLAKKSNYLCALCGVKCVHPTSLNANNEYSMDHIIPLAKGGTHTWDNVQLACRQCNGLKSDSILPNTQLRLSLC